MLCANETSIENIIHHIQHPHFTFTSPSPQVLKIIEENMSTLDLSERNPPNGMDTDTENVRSMGIGARIMRQLRRNSMSATETPAEKSNKELKKKNLNSKAIEKIYLNKKLGRLKHTQLETIFEQEDETDANENSSFEDSKVFGKRKIKRSVACTDGLNTSKTLKKKRKQRIQKIFGVHKKFKSISMKKFLERLQASDVVDVSAPNSLPGIEMACVSH